MRERGKRGGRMAKQNKEIDGLENKRRRKKRRRNMKDSEETLRCSCLWLCNVTSCLLLMAEESTE